MVSDFNMMLFGFDSRSLDDITAVGKSALVGLRSHLRYNSGSPICHKSNGVESVNSLD